MADLIDAAQDLQQREIDSVVQRHQARLVRPGLSRCEHQGCGEPIDAARQRLGARLCVDCAEEERKRSAHFATWSKAWR